MVGSVRVERPQRGIQVVDHALRILDQFESSTDELSLTELSERLTLSKRGLYALLVSLVRAGLVDRVESHDSYRLGSHLVTFAAPILGHPSEAPMAVASVEMLGRLDVNAAVVAVLEAARSLSARPGTQEVRTDDGPATPRSAPIAAP